MGCSSNSGTHLFPQSMLLNEAITQQYVKKVSKLGPTKHRGAASDTNLLELAPCSSHSCWKHVYYSHHPLSPHLVLNSSKVKTHYIIQISQLSPRKETLAEEQNESNRQLYLELCSPSHRLTAGTASLPWVNLFFVTEIECSFRQELRVTVQGRAQAMETDQGNRSHSPEFRKPR